MNIKDQADLKVRAALVTGGSGGIGSEICKRLARDGYQVVVHYGNDREAAEAVVQSIADSGGVAMAHSADIAEEDGIEQLFECVISEFGHLDVVVANAGISGGGAVEQVELADFKKLVSVNFIGAFLTLREAARRLNDGGRLIFVSSQLAERPRMGTGTYAATKAGIDAMLVSMSHELGSRGITVNSVRPGATEPGMFAGSDEARKDYFRNLSPFKRLGHPTDIAAVVSFLASDDAAWMTGQHLRADGGASN
ncbi:3-oxoacyl-[acyl-carrier-protein] reductase FabG [Novipirellula aureliae]|uniref:3-oxoacyl-[acyl-carrier-protein] reductase FabG n=1 Tax=Novipirellula aureliae TaxID=2527966 RepID=A0A5C6E912_9BACT|nr:SDR family oxidoreductase [Novipirellula aureliae]TWU45318.1 3-oxoacyl-[acyl-carrier-protein] reductase FabG [Novipirellula aureliae]